MIPHATYRLQFCKDFNFAEAAARADYFAALGISHIQASPILASRAGSRHGYDVIDHSRIDCERGGEAGFRRMAHTLRKHGIGIILDIVPNHMAVGGADNDWWLDVLSKGRDSPHARAFDIDWDAPGLKDRILAPFLGKPPQQCLDDGTLRLLRMPSGSLAFAYYEHRFPLRPQDQAALAGRDPGDLSRRELDALLARQHFVLADWRVADRRINWRRFFDITGLAALRVEDKAVFDAVHAKIFALHRDGLIDGVRVDHVDGLADPRTYLRRLRDALGPSAYIVVEKILAADEGLPDDWPVDGTTGYDVMNQISAVLHAPDASNELGRMWHEIGARSATFEPEEEAARAELLQSTFAGQCDAAARAFATANPGLDAGQAHRALSAIAVAMRAYRGYATGYPDSPNPGRFLSDALRRASNANPALADVIAQIGATLFSRTGDARSVEAIRRFNQLTPPLAAKAVEDTALYRYGRLLSRNDVGFDPATYSLPLAAFHERVAARAIAWPHSLLTTATHDHKRGEDARARLAVLSEMPEQWRDEVKRWFELNAALRPAGLDPGDEYIFYQSVVGVWPAQDAGLEALPERLAQWCRKYLREAKLRSSWLDPNEDYEACLAGFCHAMLSPTSEFAAAVRHFVDYMAPAALANTLAQTALRICLPGVPDMYQGCEFRDFSLVDPDNRHRVDFDAREAALASTAANPDAIKQHLVARLNRLRRGSVALTRGRYAPVAASGRRARHLIAFARESDDDYVLVVAARYCTSAVLGISRPSPPAGWWGDTALEGVAGEYDDILLGARRVLGARDPVSMLLTELPVIVLRRA